MTDCAATALSWAEIDALRHTGPPPARAADGARLPCATLRFECCAPRAAAALFGAVLPVAPRALLPRTGSPAACCVMRDTGKTVRASVAVGAALLCVRTGACRVEVAGLAVRAAYRGHRAVAAHLVAFAAAQRVFRPGDTLAVHVQADNTAALAFYVRTLAMRPVVDVEGDDKDEEEEVPKEAKRARTDIGTLAAEAAEALGVAGVDARALARCAAADYYPPRPACRFGSRHAFVLAVRVPDDPLQLPWAPQQQQPHKDDKEQ